jgi:hypothetical protein
MPKSKKYTSKIYKVKKSNLKKSKKGGFSWSDISNWKPDFTDLKSKFTDKMNNFSIFKKKDTQLSSPNPSPSFSSQSFKDTPSNFSEDYFSPNKVEPLINQQPTFNLPTPTYEAPKINNSINDNEDFKNIPPSSFGIQQNTMGSFDNKSKFSGGYHATNSLTNLASKATPFWQPTAKAQVLVGGKIKKTKKHKSHKKNKAHKKHKKSHKKNH